MTVYPIRKMAFAAALPLAMALSMPVATPAFAADATIEQVYSAARSGHVDDALSQMQQVLKDHPNSAKAHYVEAELLAKAGRKVEARTELGKAQAIDPGLSFAKPAAVSALKQQLSTASTSTATRTEVVQQSQNHGIPWMPIIVIGGLVFLVLAFLRRRSAVNQAYPAGPVNPNYGSPYGNQGPQGGPWGGGYPGGGYSGPGYGGPGYGAPPQQGMGGGIMSSLAGGAAAGAGFAAGEAVIDRMFGDHDREKIVERDVPVQSQSDDRRDYNQDMGGDDFGISDSGSWDDGGSSSNDDW
ncbi:MAG: tetratricopeptide repeat protein [Sphingomonadales bacterium]|nr:tetratricopeptide repeat protein [Sphingomonadales bacterium]MDE2168253.1 tetratricopeptide repeat protein [Sphingomonadales bacterium]